MLSHYFEISVGDNLNPASFFGRILYRVHGYNSCHVSGQVAVDFPNWRNASGLLSASTGNLLRILGSKESLSDLLTKTGLLQFLIDGSISVAGIKKVPEVKSYVRLSRNNKISKYGKLLRSPSQICGASQKAELATVIDHETSERFGLSIEVAMAANGILNRKIAEEKSSARMTVPSQSNGRFSLYLNRDIVTDEIESVQNFSSYGLSLNKARVPFWK